MNWFVVVPAFNAVRHIEAVLGRLSSSTADIVGHVIVVDDASTDDTVQVVEALSRAGDREHLPIALIRRARNGGYGAAMKDGLAAARVRGAEAVACVHADGQYAPEQLPRLALQLEHDAVDILQGSRLTPGARLRAWRSGGMPFYKWTAGHALNVIERAMLQLPMTDLHSGYVLYGPRALRSLPFEDFSDSFDFDLEVIAAAKARGWIIAEAPIPTHYGDETSHLPPLAYGLRVLRVLWRYRRGHYGYTTANGAEGAPHSTN